MIVPFLYHDKQQAVYHGNFIEANGLGISGVCIDVYLLEFRDGEILGFCYGFWGILLFIFMRCCSFVKCKRTAPSAIAQGRLCIRVANAGGGILTLCFGILIVAESPASAQAMLLGDSAKTERPNKILCINCIKNY